MRTTESASCQISFSDGTRQLLGRSSELLIGPLTLTSGQSRVVVPSTGAGNRLRFRLRSPAAVMGVRGTDFVANANSSGVDVNTLEGVVEVASDEAALEAGKGARVSAGYSVRAQRGLVGSPTKFNRKEFLQQLLKQQPSLEKPLLKAPLLDALARPPPGETQLLQKPPMIGAPRIPTIQQKPPSVPLVPRKR